MKQDILGVLIDDLNMPSALRMVEGWLTSKRSEKHYIVTPNPEFVMAAQRDREFKSVLNQADLAIPDGVGLKLTGKIHTTITGVDFMKELVYRCCDLGFSVGLIGGQETVAERAAECLRKICPNLKITIANSYAQVDSNGDIIGPSDGKKLAKIKAIPKTDLLFVAFGHIKQERWIRKNLDHIPVKVAMGVGGSFDYISGDIQRAPESIRKLGFEWLFRLIMQPWRLSRQTVLLKYTFLVLKKRLLA